MTAALEIDGVTAGYGDIRAVWGVSMSVEAGKAVAVLGRNGAGKTTLMRATSGLIKAMDGAIRIAGDDVTSLPAYKRVSAGLAFVEEGKKVFRERTVEENLVIGMFCLNLGRRAALERTGKVYDRFPILADRRKEPAGALSGGQQQMLAIGQALVSDPKVLLLDEPSGGLAPAIVGDVADVIREIRDEGVAIVLVEQAVDFALAVADSVVVVDLGTVVHQGPSDAPGARQLIEAAYFGRQADREDAT